jgi:hypothetical protein
MHPDAIMFLVVVALILLAFFGRLVRAIGSTMQQRRQVVPKRPRSAAHAAAAPRVERVSVAAPVPEAQEAPAL